MPYTEHKLTVIQCESQQHILIYHSTCSNSGGGIAFMDAGLPYFIKDELVAKDFIISMFLGSWPEGQEMPRRAEDDELQDPQSEARKVTIENARNGYIVELSDFESYNKGWPDRLDQKYVYERLGDTVYACLSFLKRGYVDVLPDLKDGGVSCAE